MRNILGCNPDVAGENTAWKYAEGDRKVYYYNCPVHFIPEWVWNFWSVYKGYQRARFSVPSLKDQPVKFVKACDIYERWISEFSELKAQDDAAERQLRRMGGLK